MKITGVRSAESPRRAKQWEPITAWKHNKGGYIINPILYFTDKEIWRYIYSRTLSYCSLYDEGIKRIGCVGCPMANRIEQFKRWPWMEKRWRRAASERWQVIKDTEQKPNKAKRQFKNSDEWFDWWMSNTAMPKENDCQMGLF